MNKLDKNLQEETVSAVAAPSLKSPLFLQGIRENLAIRNKLVQFTLSIGLGTAGVGCRAELLPEEASLSFFGEVKDDDASISTDLGENYYPDSSTDSGVDSGDSSTDSDLDTDDSSTDSGVDSGDSSTDSDLDTDDSSTDSGVDSGDSSIDKPTCEGSSVGTVKIIPTKGLKGEIGICINGSQVCVGNEKTAGWMVINSPIDPLGEELCNGKDDTCDGTTDEGTTKIMPVDFDPKKIGIANCKAQIIGCINGKEEEIQKKVGPTDEICNAKDDDCNGSTDDGLPPKEYYTGDLSKIGVGVCSIGKTACNPATGLYEISVPEVVPTLEICSDGVDSDCNGKTDDQCDCDPDKDGIITDMIKDPNFLAALRASLKKGPNDPITVYDTQVTTLISASSQGIQTVAGIECFQKAVEVYLEGNKLNGGVPQLEWLPAMKTVDLRNNFITSIAPLLYSIYFTKGAIAYIIEGNSLSISEVDDLKKKGVKVF